MKRAAGLTNKAERHPEIRRAIQWFTIDTITSNNGDMPGWWSSPHQRNKAILNSGPIQDIIRGAPPNERTRVRKQLQDLIKKYFLKD